jgi:deoxyribodipyrimidine photolyase-related protein
MKTLRLILGDQLNYNHSWLRTVDDNITYVLMEVREETDYTKHHIQKVIGIFAAMYNFVQFLKKRKHNVIYIQINDKLNFQSVSKNIHYLINAGEFIKFEYLLPDEYRVDSYLKKLCAQLKIETSVSDTEHFISSRDELSKVFEGKKSYLLETFYRKLRVKEGVLMQGSEPLGGKWNFDALNRQTYKGEERIPPFLNFKNDYSSIEEEIRKAKIATIGQVDAKNFQWPTTPKQAQRLADYFINKLLPNFGKYQDAMHTTNWHLFHSRLSFALNIKLVSPLGVIKQVENAFLTGKTKADIAQVEGFIRQILGWREYMRGIYWAQMPGYSNLNYFGHQNKLPDWYWTGDTKLNCLKHAIKQSLEHAYAHHIQRLMITGNFALLAQVHPNEVDAWYLGIYIDAFEWVEITNTRGMSQFADGGMVGTKPYVSSSAYIDKMSNYCKTCYYDKTKKLGDRACPFNSLYWNFYETHNQLLNKNPRVGMMLNVLHKMEKQTRQALLKQAELYLANINDL